MRPNYRADIDGLRAIAVLSILLYHLGIDSFAGGFVGVDIFFVISGYLITSIIARELSDGSFRIARFYERRVRRILPALIVVLICTLLAGSLLLTPEALVSLAKSALATTGFVSNLFFFFGSGYFEGPSELKPLLHTWSLAVEEQFYILFPLLMIAIARFGSGRYRLPLGVIATLSFAACVVVTVRNDAAAFFLIPFRAWELLLGSLLAVQSPRPVASPIARNAIAATGLAAILYSVLAFTPETRFPGIAAGLPTAGSALLIYAGGAGPTFINRAISIRPMVFIGLISYSLYLWHWPVIVYAKQLLINELSDIDRALLLLLCLLLAALSWKFVEAPFRGSARLAPPRRLFSAAAGVTLAVAGIATGIVLSGGLAARGVSPTNPALRADPGWQHWKNCEEQSEARNDATDLCSIGSDTGPIEFMLWGDSHALAMASAVHLAAIDRKLRGEIAVRTACPPLLLVDRQRSDSHDRSCSDFNSAIATRLRQEPEIKTVIVAARWTMSAVGERYKQEPGSRVQLIDLGSDGAVSTDNLDIFESGLARTLNALQAAGKRILLVGPIPEIGVDVPSRHYIARLTGRDVNAAIAPGIDDFRERTASVYAVLERLAVKHAAIVLDPASLLCDAVRCNVTADGLALYRDDNHLSLKGNLILLPLFVEALAAPP